MYYEERVINGRSEFRTHPEGAWKPLPGMAHADHQALLMKKRIAELEALLNAARETASDWKHLHETVCVCLRDAESRLAALEVKP